MKRPLRSLPSCKARRCSALKLSLEQLEPRYVLNGDVYLINFQFDEVQTPNSYLRDVGAVFGDRGNGLSYGWSSDHSDVSRDRGLELDQRIDSLIHFHQNQTWELELPNGPYEVTAVVGDPANNDGVHTLNVEGINFFNAVADGNEPLSHTTQVTVSDGRLTLDSGNAAEKATRIDYIQVIGLPSGPNAAPTSPTIMEPAVDGRIVDPSDVPTKVAGFSDPDGDAHVSSDWEIWTVGPIAEQVWVALGGTGAKRLHTDLGDGFFENSHAGRRDLKSNTDYELRVRFRDSEGSVSAFASRRFHTASASATFPLEIGGIASTPAPTWETVFGTTVDLPNGNTILSPGDPIIAVDTDSASAYPGNESPPNAIDGTLAKYLNFGEINSGFIVTPSSGPSVVTSFQITTANDAEERDPTTWQIFGTNSPVVSADNSNGSAEPWTLIDSGSVSLPSARDTLGPVVAVSNTTSYTSYRMIFTGVKNSSAANSMQIGEIQFSTTGDDSTVPASLRVESPQDEVMLTVTGDSQPGNIVTNYPALAVSAEVRVVLSGGSRGLSMPLSDLTFADENGDLHTVYLPAINLAANDEIYLWVSSDGSTYFGTSTQTEPSFSNLARAAQANIPFVAAQPGYVVEEVSSDYRLPVNIAFVPNPGPNPDDPLYYVTELYGSIQVVTRDGTKHEFATGLLDYNPQGPISGVGEQGLTGIAVQRDVLNPEVYHLYVSMLWDNGSPPGGATHYPKVERIDSAAGGLSMDSRTLLLNMQPETQGQSHQISNVSIGPDGKLYVHVGDGFNSSTALNLDQFRGKILRMNVDGAAPVDNPFYNAADGTNSRDYIYAYGFRNPFGGAWRTSDGKHYSVENGPSVDRLAQINAGVNYGWDGSNASMATHAIYNWDPAHAPVNITFVQESTFGGSAFPADKMDVAFVSESGPTYAEGTQAQGKRIVEFHLDSAGNLVEGPTSFVEYIGTGHASVVGLAAGPGGIYFTELYEDSGANGPTASGARIFRVRYVGGDPADFNIDGSVDGLDLAVWQDNNGTSTGATRSDGNADGDSDVDGRDFLAWQRQFTGGAAANSTTEVLAAAKPYSARDVDANSASLASLVTTSVNGTAPSVDVPDTKLAAAFDKIGQIRWLQEPQGHWHVLPVESTTRLSDDAAMRLVRADRGESALNAAVESAAKHDTRTSYDKVFERMGRSRWRESPADDDGLEGLGD